MNQLEIDRQQDLEEMIMTIALHDFDNINKVFIKPEWFENRLFKIILNDERKIFVAKVMEVTPGFHDR